MAISWTNKPNDLDEVHALAIGTAVGKNGPVSIKFSVASPAKIAIGIGIERLVNGTFFARRTETQQDQNGDQAQTMFETMNRHIEIYGLRRGFALVLG
jgi:hypothetical protein